MTVSKNSKLMGTWSKKWLFINRFSLAVDSEVSLDSTSPVQCTSVKNFLKCADVVRANLQFQSDVIALDVEFGDRVGKHRLAAHNGVGHRRSGV